MPTNLMLVDSQFPRLDQGEGAEESISKLQNYLYMLVEQLRYSLHNLDLSNLNSAAWEEMKMEISKPIYVALADSTGGTAELEATVQGLKSTVEQQGQSITEFQQTANSLNTSVTNLQNGMRQTLRMDATGVYITDANGNVVSINGGQLKAETVIASKLIGSSISLLYSAAMTGGYINITPASSGLYAVELESTGALRLVANGGAVWMQTNYSSFALSNTEAAAIFYQGIYPDADASHPLGNANYRWAAVYASTGTIQTSDRNAKHDIELLPEKYVDLFDRLDVYRYKMNDGTSDRYHVGFVAQDVEEDMAESGIDSLEFGGLVKDKDADGKDVYMLRYDEFIGVLAAKIKQLGARIAALEGTI